MQAVHLRKYGVEAKINFELYEVDGVDFRVDAADAGSDCTIMKDEGAEATCTNDFVDEGMGYSLTLTSTEMQAARIVVYVVDSATKVWLDKAIVIETYGNASAQHAFDLATATVNIGGLAAASAAKLDDILDGTGEVTLTLENIVINNSSGVGVAITGTTGGVAIVASNGTGMTVSSTGGNGSGIQATGNGNGEGILAVGGSDGHGIEARGGTTAGHGLFAWGRGTDRHGIYAQAADTGDGIRARGGTAGNGFGAEGGSTSGSGAKFWTDGTNDIGLEIIGLGSGAGMQITGGATGVGVDINGGGTSGVGLAIDTTSGTAVELTAGGGNGHGLSATGAGTGEGIVGTGGITGDGIKGVGGSGSGAGFYGLAAVGDGARFQGSATGVRILGSTLGIDIDATGGTAIDARSGGGNGDGLYLAGNGSGAGMKIAGGATGIGLDINGGSSSGNAIDIDTVDGVGISIDGSHADGLIYVNNTGGRAAYFLSSGSNGEGLRIDGHGTGDGCQINGGTTSGVALYLVGAGSFGNGSGLKSEGAGTGHGIEIVGGATGHGIKTLGGASSGAGLYAGAQANNDAGIEAVKHGTGNDITGDTASFIKAYNLDHLMKTAVANNADMTTEVTDGSVLSNLMSKTSNTSTFVVADDSLQGISEGAAGGGATVDQILDELLSGHTTDGTVGEALNTLGTAGALTVTVTCDDGTNPLEGAAVWITSDQAGTDVLAGTFYTNTSGQVTFEVDAGTYWCWRQLSGYEFSPNPEQMVVS